MENKEANRVAMDGVKLGVSVVIQKARRRIRVFSECFAKNF